MLILSPGIYNVSAGTPKTTHAQGSHRANRFATASLAPLVSHKANIDYAEWASVFFNPKSAVKIHDIEEAEKKDSGSKRLG
jgi:hypothetical protein